MPRMGAVAQLFVTIAFLANASFARADQLTIVGTGDGLDMLRAVASSYSEKNPGHDIVVPPSIGSGGGIAAVASDREMMGRVARPLSDLELAQGIKVIGVARIPSAIYVNPKVTVADITTVQLAGIFGGSITNWKDLGGADQKIRVVRREDGDSTLQALRGSMPGWKELAITPLSKQAVTTQDAIESVAKVDGAIGFGPFSRNLEPGVKVLKIDGRMPIDAGYPSAVSLALIYKAAREDAEIRSFIDFIKSQSGIAIIDSFGAVPLTN